MANSNAVYDQMYMQYPAPSPPAPAAGPSLLNEQEFNHLNGFLETFTDDAFQLPGQTKFSAYDFGFFGAPEPQFPQMSTVSHHQQQYMGNGLTTTTDNIGNLDNSSRPNGHPNSSPHNNMPLTPPQPANEPAVIVNPFTGHGLITNPLQMPSEEASLNSLAWGSDPSFGNAGFQADLQPPTVHDLQAKVLAIMVPNSSGNTTANSPVDVKFERLGEDVTGSDTSSNFTTGNAQSPTLSATRTSGVKRPAEDEEDGQIRRSRPRKDSSTEPSSKGKRGGKREQLTEAEKRANHIQSEQKRRNQIKFGFDTLTEMVPDLKGGGYSKSAVLQHAAVYVETLVGGNATLRDLLKGLEEQHDGGSSSTPSGSGKP